MKFYGRALDWFSLTQLLIASAHKWEITLYWRTLSVPAAEKGSPISWYEWIADKPFARQSLVGFAGWGQGCGLGSEQWWIEGPSINTPVLSESISVPHSWCFTICRQASLPEISQGLGLISCYICLALHLFHMFIAFTRSRSFKAAPRLPVPVPFPGPQSMLYCLY